jgi:hypothetical protein
MGINRLRRRDGVLPLFLHLGVHNEQRVVWEMYRDLALCIGERAVCFAILVTLCDYLADTKLASYAKAEATDNCTRAEICELICVVAYILFSAVITVDKSGVRFPWVR